MFHNVAAIQRVCARPRRGQESFEQLIVFWILRGSGTLGAVIRRDIYMVQAHLLHVYVRHNVVILERKRSRTVDKLVWSRSENTFGVHPVEVEGHCLQVAASVSVVVGSVCTRRAHGRLCEVGPNCSLRRRLRSQAEEHRGSHRPGGDTERQLLRYVVVSRLVPAGLHYGSAFVCGGAWPIGAVA